jgi:hypothetical protein
MAPSDPQYRAVGKRSWNSRDSSENATARAPSPRPSPRWGQATAGSPRAGLSARRRSAPSPPPRRGEGARGAEKGLWAPPAHPADRSAGARRPLNPGRTRGASGQCQDLANRGPKNLETEGRPQASIFRGALAAAVPGLASGEVETFIGSARPTASAGIARMGGASQPKRDRLGCGEGGMIRGHATRPSRSGRSRPELPDQPAAGRAGRPRLLSKTWTKR